MFSVTEWREIGDFLWDATLSGSKSAKDLGTTWREVMNHLRSMVAEKKMAMAASDLLGRETESMESIRLFGQGVPSAKGIIVPIKKSATELLHPTPSPEGATATGALRRPDSYREPPPVLDEDEGTRAGPSAPLNESAESDKENEPTPAAPMPRPRTKPSDRTLNRLLQQLNECHLPTAGRDVQVLTEEGVILHPAAPQSRWSVVVRDAILEGEWQAASAVACPVQTTALPAGSAAAVWKPFDFFFCFMQLRQTVTQYGLQSEPAKHLLNYLFDSEIMTPSDCTSLARLLLTPAQFPAPRQRAVPCRAVPRSSPRSPAHPPPRIPPAAGEKRSPEFGVELQIAPPPVIKDLYGSLASLCDLYVKIRRRKRRLRASRRNKLSML
ncbi:uncharacterized protein LOC129783056 [Falco peregrinus]|uniref:uncharacterized protein LOC129783056 n=1 Tax=Falco peregrinus TaxID=8954 RepID=UPI00247A5550|nr:uncharacterized protein LOC129783056 [Falco peregrinus]